MHRTLTCRLRGSARYASLQYIFVNPLGSYPNPDGIVPPVLNDYTTGTYLVVALLTLDSNRDLIDSESIVLPLH